MYEGIYDSHVMILFYLSIYLGKKITSDVR